MSEQPQREKTYKRELAFVLFAMMFIFFGLGLFYEQAMIAAQTLMTPTFLFGGGAMGMDAYSKQIQGGSTQGRGPRV